LICSWVGEHEIAAFRGAPVVLQFDAVQVVLGELSWPHCFVNGARDDRAGLPPPGDAEVCHVLGQ
jgi:hypothetical protein